jgi:peptide/nickel transport system permease protein
MLALFTIVLAVAVSVPLGVLAAWRHGGWLDRGLMGLVLASPFPSSCWATS